ncbi:MAG: DUF5996 family protein [Gemmatimonadota bacterium]
MNDSRWPALPLQEWEPTYGTLHRWTQIVGKIRLARTPWINHSWHVTLYLTARGLGTSSIPYDDRSFEIGFDFVDHRLTIAVSDGRSGGFDLQSESVADFHGRLFEELARMDLHLVIDGRPNEVEDATPFTEDRRHASYDPEYAHRLWVVLGSAERVFTEFRSRFIGKSSPVHFFWGSFDLAVSRFSGRIAPRHPGGIPNLPDWIVREAYSHEVASAGFWPGGGPHPFPLFYAYVYPEPEGYRGSRVSPMEAFFSSDLGEFVLPYDVVRQSSSPEEILLEFLESTYAAAAERAGWNRPELERGGDPRAVYTRGG